jgi:hypothetical protein
MAFSLFKGKIMNRRTFLQSVGAVAVAISAPKALAKEKQQVSEFPKFYKWENLPAWTDFVDHMPMTGQNVAVVTYFENHTGVNIFTGIVSPHRFGSEQGETVLIEMEMSYSPDGYFRRNVHVLGKPRGIDCDICLYGSLAREENVLDAQKKIHKAMWITQEEVYTVGGPCMAPRNNYKKTPYIGRDRSWWIPISDLIPERLPTLPDPRPLIRDGEGNLRK